MTGKVFADSANIYDDQAKVLFDYYKKAAEKIVTEEIEMENKIQALQEEITKTEKQKKICLFLCWLIIPLIMFFVKKSKLKKMAAQMEELQTAKANIRKDYKVSKIGVAYVPVATRVPFEGKSFVVDHTGETGNTDFSLSVLHQPEELRKSLSKLEEGLDNVPVVEGNEESEQIDTSSYSKSVQEVTMHDYMGNIDRQVRNISYLLSDSDKRSVALPVIEPQSAGDQFIDEYATTETADKPIVKVFSTDGFEDKLDSFSKLNDLKKELEKNSDENNTEYFKKLIRKLGDSVQIVSRLKTNSTSKLLDYSTEILSAVLKAGYNQYSPQLEAEELSRIRDSNFNYEDCVENYKPFELKESSKVKYEIYSKTWVAEDNTRTNMPFGINQIEEEVLMPLINNLMMETRIERLKIYANIKDQKLSYLNKWHQDVEAAFRDNRKSGQDLITQITNAYAEYSTAHNTYLSYKSTQDQMRVAGMAGAEVQEQISNDDEVKELEAKVEECREAGDAFQLYMTALQQDINASSEKFGYVEYYEATLRDTESKKIAESIVPENLQNLDPRRQKLIPINSYFATNAELPPLPSVEDKLIDDFTLDLQQVATSELYKIEQETIAGVNAAAEEAPVDEEVVSEENADIPAEDVASEVPVAEETPAEEPVADEAEGTYEEAVEDSDDEIVEDDEIEEDEEFEDEEIEEDEEADEYDEDEIDDEEIDEDYEVEEDEEETDEEDIDDEEESDEDETDDSDDDDTPKGGAGGGLLNKIGKLGGSEVSDSLNALKDSFKNIPGFNK
ncbi:MAG: hypothetical protein MJ162_05790 [Treponema sp.]|nr:hypothetical protein [Treponema sp.]